jgi:hypothetical protein
MMMLMPCATIWALSSTRRLDITKFESITLLFWALSPFLRLRFLHMPTVDYWYGYASVMPAQLRQYTRYVFPFTHLQF